MEREQGREGDVPSAIGPELLLASAGVAGYLTIAITNGRPNAGVPTGFVAIRGSVIHNSGGCNVSGVLC